ncbi:RsmB/NOP family class I SAM-dependent RNA methyltransferase [Deferrisoma camini]|uniref:RsmB/NOP family class I SAM-dependent RNA methyltransferase n=1 Tax=Deferrisoma camini TaxID=1035120 RepID=UPI00046D4422|nr:RsmB/NOP family class I SAM-dependent RNA methyltransferase [Deferrisoma camini]
MSRFARRFDRYREIVPDFEAFCEAHERPAPVHLRVNPRKAAPAWVVDRLARAGVRVRPEPWYPHLLRVEAAPEGFAFGATLVHALGFVYIQSASSAASALALGARPGHRVLDLCAAPGSKTTLLVQEMDDRGLVVANEPNRRRIKSLVTNLERMGAASALVTAYAGQNFPKRVRFDRILVDAPCSGEGTWRGPRAKPRRITPEFRSGLVRQQTGLLERAWDLLEPGGVLVYSTCTYAPEENEAVVADLVERTGAEVLPVPVDVPARPGLTAWQERTFPPSLARTARLFPHRLDSEGFFVARLAKP